MSEYIKDPNSTSHRPRTTELHRMYRDATDSEPVARDSVKTFPLFPSGGDTWTFPPSLKSMNPLDSMFLGVSHHQLERTTGDANGIHEVVVITSTESVSITYLSIFSISSFSPLSLISLVLKKIHTIEFGKWSHLQLKLSRAISNNFNPHPQPRATNAPGLQEKFLQP